jgi:hypothetical protein
MNEFASWQQQLVDGYPDLFVRRFRGVPFSPGYPICGDGWRDIVTKMVERMSAAATHYRVHFAQISEGYGTLRVYWRAEAALPTHVERAIEELIALAEARSACTCTTCGAEGRLFSSKGWLLTACAEHARGKAVPTQPGLENMHIVRGRVGEDMRICTCRRYDRTLDAFVHVDPCSLGSEQLS